MVTDPRHRGPLIRSFEVALRGITEAWCRERNFRIQVVYAALMVGLACWLRPERGEVLVLSLALFALLSAELMNTAVERAVDLATETHHPLARSAKDIAAGSVLVVAVGTALVSMAILAPHLPWNSWLAFLALQGLALSSRSERGARLL